MSALERKNGRIAPLLVTISVVVVLIIAGTLTVVLSRSSSGAKAGPEGVAIAHVPNLAPASTTLKGRTVDGVSCRPLSKETVTYHIHVHVAVFVNGNQLRLPAGIGITKPFVVQHYASGPFDDVGLYDCLYWIHTHVADGIVHVEAPEKRTFNLGQLFDVWGQPLDRNRVGPARGKVIVYENGKRLVADPRSTALLPGGDIQIDVGTPKIAFQPFPFKVTGSCGQGTLTCTTATTTP